jgi:hypothetical protein
MSDDILEKLRVAAGAEIERLRYDAPLRRRALIHRAADEIERLRARVEVLRDALSGTHTWLGAAIQCPAFEWDADQKQAAQRDYDDARAALEAKP